MIKTRECELGHSHEYAECDACGADLGESNPRGFLRKKALTVLVGQWLGVHKMNKRLHFCNHECLAAWAQKKAEAETP